MRVLPADVYDTLEFSALAFGGIGAGADFDYDALDPYNYPCCVHGLARAASERGPDNYTGKCITALFDAGIRRGTNDDAVIRINRRKRNADPERRVTFQEWRKELEVVRGE